MCNRSMRVIRRALGHPLIGQLAVPAALAESAIAALDSHGDSHDITCTASDTLFNAQMSSASLGGKILKCSHFDGQSNSFKSAKLCYICNLCKYIKNLKKLNDEFEIC